MKKIWKIFAALSVLLSDIMCAVVAYTYCTLSWGAQYAGYSAPPSTAFLYAIPFIAAIIICIVLAVVFHR